MRERREEETCGRVRKGGEERGEVTSNAGNESKKQYSGKGQGDR